MGVFQKGQKSKKHLNVFQMEKSFFFLSYMVQINAATVINVLFLHRHLWRPHKASEGGLGVDGDLLNTV